MRAIHIWWTALGWPPNGWADQLADVEISSPKSSNPYLESIRIPTSPPLLRRHSFKEECLGVSNVHPSAALVKVWLLIILRLQAYLLARFVGKVVRLQLRVPTKQLCPFTEGSETNLGLPTDLLSGGIRQVSMQLSPSVVHN